LQNNVNPMMARLHARGDLDEIGAMIRRARRWFVPGLASVCVLAAALYPAVIPWLLGDPAFAAGAVPFAILMAGIALASPYLPFSQLLLMARRPGWHTVLLLCVIAINVTGNLVLIPRLGLSGAASSTAGAMVAAALLLRGLAHRCAGVQL
jgi:O-antigen/teichoic acid export membrane protein